MSPIGKTQILLVMNADQNFRLKRRPVAETARNRGYEVHVAYPHGDDTSSAEALDFPHHRFPMSRRGLNPIGESWTAAKLAMLYRKVEPDLVHHLTLKPAVHGGLAARAAGVPAVVSGVTGLGTVFVEDGLKRRFIRSGVEVGLRVAFGHPHHRCIVQNPDDADLLQKHAGLAEGETRLVRGSGVDTDRFDIQPEPEGPPIVVLPTRMLWSKGVREFVEAARHLGEEVEARFALVGDTDSGNPEAVPRERLEAWDDGGVVEWWGWQDYMPGVYDRSAIVCLPSAYREGVPKSLIEAASSGRPLVTTDIPGCREIVRDGHNGLVVPPRDSEALADSLKTLIEDPDLRRSMGKRGRSLVEESFSLEEVVDRTISVYEELIEAPSKEA